MDAPRTTHVCLLAILSIQRLSVNLDFRLSEIADGDKTAHYTIKNLNCKLC